MIKFLADENIPPAIVKFLRHKGFDVKEVRELVTPGTSDTETMGLACREERSLLTFDKHFANILLYPLNSHYGVIRFRLHPPLLPDIIEVFERFLQKFDLTTIRGTLIVLDRNGFRVRRVP